MKITVVSDLHLEFTSDYRLNNPGSDILILSGDICVANYLQRGEKSPHYQTAQGFREFFKQCSDEWDRVIYVAGNHEHYHGVFEETVNILDEQLSSYRNIVVLNNECIDLGDYRIIGSTLWFDGNNNDPITLYTLNHSLNDFRLITHGYNTGWSTYKFTPEDAVKEYQKSIDYIDRTIDKNKKNIVVGHHTPSQQSIHEDYKNEYYVNGGYHNHLDNFIFDRPEIVCWTHGHTHNSFDYHIGSTRVICNPKGYGDQNKEYNEGLIIEV